MTQEQLMTLEERGKDNILKRCFNSFHFLPYPQSLRYIVTLILVISSRFFQHGPYLAILRTALRELALKSGNCSTPRALKSGSS